MKPGDLVCYNAAGQKSKTLGLVLEIKKDIEHITPAVLIQWACIGNGMLPRTASRDIFRNSKKDKIRSGELVWHVLGSWFEIVK